MQRIAISYRRSDSTAIAGRIADRLAATYGKEAIFIDVDSVPFGADFRKHIRQVWREIAVLIVVIGPNWLGVGQEGASGKIQESGDPVRVEVETALKRKIAVIPVLVDRAKMPTARQLPPSLRAFADRNAAELDGGRDFHAHMERLIRAIDAIVGRSAGKPAPHAAAGSAGQQPIAPPWAALLVGETALAVFVLAALQHVIVNVFDLDTTYLRIVSFVVPFAFGVASGWQVRRPAPSWLAVGAGIGLLAVAAMAVSTGLSAGRPILPATPFEWRESVEYAVSIAVSFFAGCVITRLIEHSRS